MTSRKPTVTQLRDQTVVDSSERSWRRTGRPTRAQSRPLWAASCSEGLFEFRKFGKSL